MSNNDIFHFTSVGGAWRNCPWCGKLFFAHDIHGWVYKAYVYNKQSGVTHKKMFCSWGCMRAFEKEKNRKKGIE